MDLGNGLSIQEPINEAHAKKDRLLDGLDHVEEDGVLLDLVDALAEPVGTEIVVASLDGPVEIAKRVKPAKYARKKSGEIGRRHDMITRNSKEAQMPVSGGEWNLEVELAKVVEKRDGVGQN